MPDMILTILELICQPWVNNNTMAHVKLSELTNVRCQLDIIKMEM
jgi:hypothetical protein